MVKKLVWHHIQYQAIHVFWAIITLYLYFAKSNCNEGIKNISTIDVGGPQER